VCFCKGLIALRHIIISKNNSSNMAITDHQIACIADILHELEPDKYHKVFRSIAELIGVSSQEIHDNWGRLSNALGRLIMKKNQYDSLFR
jgi:hypothetical protein